MEKYPPTCSGIKGSDQHFTFRATIHAEGKGRKGTDFNELFTTKNDIPQPRENGAARYLLDTFIEANNSVGKQQRLEVRISSSANDQV